MRSGSFKYLLKEGVRSLWTNRVMAFTSIGVLTTCLLIVGVAYLITANVNSMVKYVESQSEMSVYLLQDADEDTVAAVGETITQNANVAGVEFISKEQGLLNTQSEFGEDKELLDSFKGDRNPLPDTYNVTLKDISLTRQTQSELEQISGVETVVASSQVADTFTGVQRIVTALGGAIILALGIISLVIISNTIRATIFARRKEINIMKFVGATNSFIRIPFLVEGFMLGLISALVSFLIIWGGYSYLISALNTNLSAFLESAFSNIIPFEDLAGQLALFFGVTGTVLGTFGSSISIRNHVKV